MLEGMIFCKGIEDRKKQTCRKQLTNPLSWDKGQAKDNIMSDRLPSTGRRPAMGPSEIESLLQAYFSSDNPSLEELRQRFTTTSKSGVERPMSLATVRKYLKAAGIELPRGKAAVKERQEGRKAPCSVQTMLNRIPTEVLIGEGQAKLLARLLERGEHSQKALGEMFGVSRDRVRRFRDAMNLSESTPEPVVEASEAEAEAAPAEEPAEAVESNTESEAPVAEAESESEVDEKA